MKSREWKQLSRDEACGLLPPGSKCTYKNGWLNIGIIGVDAGEITCMDPTYACDPTWKKWKTGIDKKLIPDKVHFIAHDMGMTFESGMGDGGYPIFAKMLKSDYSGVRVSAVRIDMINPRQK